MPAKKKKTGSKKAAVKKAAARKSPAKKKARVAVSERKSGGVVMQDMKETA
ncbi:MAG: hypothetical protein HS115_11565 [Spirochaetales bacterium]|nr:hypothetical protein [Spirochaetales bacterium]